MKNEDFEIRNEYQGKKSLSSINIQSYNDAINSNESILNKGTDVKSEENMDRGTNGKSEENNYKNFNDFDNINWFEDFKTHKRGMINKKNEIETYIKKFIEPIISDLEDKMRLSNNEINNKEINNKKENGTNTIINYSFINLMYKLKEKESITKINDFFKIFDFIKNKLPSFDYNLFIKYFLDKFKNKNILTFINNISMIKIYVDLKNAKKEKEIKSFINEKNYLCKAIFENIIDDFKIENINGLYNYINFKFFFNIETKKNIKDLEYHVFLDLFNSLSINNIDRLSNYNYINQALTYSFGKYSKNNKREIEQYLKDNEQTNIKYNKLIEDQCANDQNLNIIYDLFDKFDSNEYGCRKKFYKKLFKIIYENEEKYLNDILFLNSIMILILKDDKNIFKILSLHDTIDNEDRTKLGEIFREIIMKITQIIEEKYDYLKNNQNKDSNRQQSEILINSLLIFLKLFGEYNNISFHKIICSSNYFNSNNNLGSKNISNIQNNDIIYTRREKEEEFIVIKKLFNMYIETYLSFDLNISSIKKNKLIFFNCLTQCITEYINIDEKIKEDLKKILDEKGGDLEKKEKSLLEKITETNEDDNKINKINANSDEDLKKLFSIINNSLLFYTYCIKNLNLRDECTCEKCLEKMHSYFEIFLHFNNEIKLIDNDDKMIENKEILLEFYQNNKFEKDFLFNLILLNYQIIFHFNDLPGFEICKSFLYIGEENNLDIAIKYINEKFIDKRNLLLPLFLFLEEIRDIIEIKMNEKSINLMNILTPEIFNLNKYSETYFNHIIDYSDRENKLLSIYNNIECLIYDIKYKKSKYNKLFENLFNYKIEGINYICVLLENISLVAFYSKSTEDSIEKYNQIDNRKTFPIFSTFIGIHCCILFLIFLGWIIFRAKLDFFYSITKYANKNSEKLVKLSLNQKVKLLDNNSNIKEFIPKESKKEYKTINYFRNNRVEKGIEKLFNSINNRINYSYIYVYFIKNIYPFLFTLIFLILYLFDVQIFLVFPLIFMFNSSASLFGIIKVLLKQAKTLFLLLLYMIVLLYIFGLLGFFYFPKMFKYESVNNNNELIYYEENICSSTISCILYFFYYGLISEGSIDMNLISYKNNTSYYWGQFFFNIILYSIIHMIFFNVILALVTNGFDKMRESIAEIDYNKKNICFICQKTRNDCINDGENFDEHLFKHNKWKYIIFICNIILKDKKELSEQEYKIYQLINEGRIDWFPEYNQAKEIDIQKKYKLPSLTIDTIILKKNNNNKSPDILLMKRKEKPFAGKYAFPGGFVKYDEYPQFTCYRILKKKTGLNIKDFEENIELLTVRGDPKRDPRRHVITIVYILYIKANSEAKVKDIKEIEFHNLETDLDFLKNEMSFDHYSIIEEFLEKKFPNILKKF